jgi:hypothetical protein
MIDGAIVDFFTNCLWVYGWGEAIVLGEGFCVGDILEG